MQRYQKLNIFLQVLTRQVQFGQILALQGKLWRTDMAHLQPHYQVKHFHSIFGQTNPT